MTREDVSPGRLDVSEFPDLSARRRLEALIGVERVVEPLARDLTLILQPQYFEEWANNTRLDENLAALVLKRARVAILAGDVGTGKTEICETIGDHIARKVDIPVTLFRMGLQSRGSGFVGEMTKLITEGFQQVIRSASQWKKASGPRAGAILFIDEADAFAQSRELGQMHHEDRAGVNALIRGIDDIRNADIPVAILMATNRLDALDPAVRRRAGSVYILERPSEIDRENIFRKLLRSVCKSEDSIVNIVYATGPIPGRAYGYTYSDIFQRLLPQFVLAAYPESKIDIDLLMHTIASVEPTPPFRSPSDLH